MEIEREIRRRLVHLLGFIVLMEEKIEILKQELAGHDEFDTRVAFSMLDSKARGFVTLQDLLPVVSGMGSGLSLDTRSHAQLSSFLKRYGNGERLTYTEFLKEFRPKMNIQLSQSLLVRNIVKRHLPDHLKERFELLVAYYMLLAAESERLRLQIQIELGTNIVEIYEIVRDDLASESRIQAFFQEHGDAVSKHQTRYLINHTKDLKEFEEWTEQELKEIFCPVGSMRRFEEPRTEASINFQQRSPNTQPEFRPVRKDNYLAVRFNNTAQAALGFQEFHRTDTFGNSELQTGSRAINRQTPTPPPNIKSIDRFMVNALKGDVDSIRDSRTSQTGSLAIRNRPKVLMHQPQLQKFMLPPGKISKAMEVFDDDLEESQRSAFRYY